jgi:hypothetical protein
VLSRSTNLSGRSTYLIWSGKCRVSERFRRRRTHLLSFCSSSPSPRPALRLSRNLQPQSYTSDWNLRFCGGGAGDQREGAAAVNPRAAARLCFFPFMRDWANATVARCSGTKINQRKPWKTGGEEDEKKPTERNLGGGIRNTFILFK